MAWSLLEQIENHEGPIKPTLAAKWLGCSRKTVYARINKKEIPTVQLSAGAEESKLIDPKTWAFVLRKRNPMMREAARHG
jgi:hypothetical protein